MKTKPLRTIRLLKPLDGSGRNGIVRIVIGKHEAVYFLDRVHSSEFGEAFVIERWDEIVGDDAAYRVCLRGKDSTCECKGYKYRAHCRHIEGLLSLKRAEKI